MTTGTSGSISSIPLNTSCGLTPIQYGKVTSWNGADGKMNKTNNYLKTTTFVDNGQLLWSLPDEPDTQFSGTFYGCFGSGGNFSYQDPEQFIDSARNRVLSQIRGHNFSPAVTAAESIKTANMVASTATNLANSIRALRRGNFSRAASLIGVRTPSRVRNTADPAFQAWLQMKYGWVPLLSDIKNACEFLAKPHKPPTVTFQATTQYSSGSVLPIYSGRYDMNESFRVRAQLKAQLDDFQSLQLDNPAAVAWELLPWSFVVDWFLPIGNYIENVHTASQVQSLVLSSQLTVKSKQLAVDQGFSDYIISGGASSSSFTFSRKPIILTPPLPSFKKPKWTGDRMFTSIALLASVFNKDIKVRR